ncbi:MAG: hypothetical protein ABH821_01620 [archaeon]
MVEMNKQELIEKLQDIEWEDFEVKEAKSEVPKNSWESVSAFSNTSGGCSHRLLQLTKPKNKSIH